MKKNLLYTFNFILFCTATFCAVQAQNTSPYWSLAGNSNSSNTTSKLGTTNSVNLRFYTKNLERMRLDTLGHIGVNTLPNSGVQVQVNSASNIRPMRLLVNNSIRFLFHYNGGLTVGNGTQPPAQGLYVAGNVGIGTATPAYKLHVEGGSASAAVYGNSSSGYGVYGNGYYGVYGTSGSYGVYGYASGGLGYGYGVTGVSSYTGVTGSGGSYGVSGYCTSTSSGYGVYGSATTNASGIGVYGTGYYGVKAISPTLYGVDGTGYYVGVVGHGASNNTSSYGVEGYGNTNGAGVYGSGGFIGVQGSGATGVQGYATSSTGRAFYGSGVSGAWAGYFAGPVFATSYSGSDRKLKKNIEDVSTAINIINQLHPKTYEYRQDGNYKYMHLPEGKHYGLIAQELEQVLPTLVKDTKFDTRIEQQAEAKAQSGGAPITHGTTQASEVIDFKAVNYTELIPILVKAVQEQQAQIEELKNEVSSLKQAQNSVTYSNGNALSQNTPNPANSTTRISYNLPAGTSQAQLIVTDAVGKTVKALSLNSSGALNLNTTGLSSGVYNYSLMVGGKILETKKMEVVR